MDAAQSSFAYGTACICAPGREGSLLTIALLL